METTRREAVKFMGAAATAMAAPVAAQAQVQTKPPVAGMERLCPAYLSGRRAGRKYLDAFAAFKGSWKIHDVSDMDFRCHCFEALSY